jgi:hypothetical protein
MPEMLPSMLNRLIALLTLALLAVACGGQDNISDCDSGKKQIPCTEKSAEEKGRLALDGKRFEEAVENFALAIEGEPENYNLYTLLATAYAGAAGFNLLDVTKAQIGGQGSILELMGSFLPTPAAPCQTDDGEDKTYTLCIDAMEEARTTANLPEGGLADPAADYYKTAAKQILFYSSASTVMQINRFAISSASGTFDPALLETMTEEDAVNILNTLASSGTAAGLSDEQSQTLKAKIADAEALIQGQNGGNSKEKVAAFIAAEYQPQTGNQ